MPVNVLTRPIHPLQGDGSIRKAQRLAQLFTNIGLLAVINGLEYIQGETLPIPLQTTAEKYGKPTGNATGGVQRETQAEKNEAQDNPSDQPAGSDISLQSEGIGIDVPLLMEVEILRDPANLPTKEDLQGGATMPNSAGKINVGVVLGEFDQLRATPIAKGGGNEAALRNLYAKPVAAFGMNLDAVIEKLKAEVDPNADAFLSLLPGVTG